MPQKQRNRVPADPEGEPELLVPASRIDEELASRATQGQELLETIFAYTIKRFLWPCPEQIVGRDAS